MFDQLGESGAWGKIVFQGSAYPIRNPAQPGESTLIPRNELKAFFAVLEDCSVAENRIGYGDYAADSGEVIFSTKGGGKPIPHLRYTTRTDTLVVRGKPNVSIELAIREVCEAIVKNPEFSGRDFSYADEKIWLNSRGAGHCGSSPTWREWNTAHHLTHVVDDLGRRSGKEFGRIAIMEISEQEVMFGD